MRRMVAIVLGAVVLSTALVLTAPPESARAAGPAVTVSPIVSSLAIPWDISFATDGTMLFTERAGRLSVRLPNGTVRQLSATFTDLFVGSETGLMGIQVDPGFATNRVFYTCQGFQATPGVPVDIRVVKWTVNSALTVATKVSDVVTGLPISSGRHGGCRLRFDTAGYLYVGTGDSATNGVPQNRTSLGGKVLRVLTSGTNVPAPGNPFIGSANARERLVFTYGHRNVQGLALRPGSNTMFSVEHGTGCDDEVNRLSAGADYGWRPAPVGGSYNEDEPMTAPGATAALYSSGCPTEALSGATFLVGAQWGAWNGALVVPALKNSYLRVMLLNPDGSVRSTELMPELTGTYGRLRTAQLGPDGALYVTTSNGSNDAILRVAPRPVGPQPGADSPAVVRGSTFYFRNSLTSGQADHTAVYGNPAGDIPLICDWNGDGVGTLGIVRDGVWWISDSIDSTVPPRSFFFGNPGDIPICGDWDGDGRDGPGVVRDGGWWLRNLASTGPHDIAFRYGNPGDRVVVGDWNGDRRDGPGVTRGNVWWLRNDTSTGPHDFAFAYGNPGDGQLVGDWNGDGIDSPGVTRGPSWYLRNAVATGPHDIFFTYGTFGDVPFGW